MPRNKQEEQPQTTILDLTNCMDDQKVVEGLGEMDTMLKQLVIEADNPALIELDKLYKENPELKINDSRVKRISDQLEEQLQSFDINRNLDVIFSDDTEDIKGIKSIKDPRIEYGNSSVGIAKHLAFVVQTLNNDHSLSDVMNGYEAPNKEEKISQRVGILERMQNQFDKDIDRTPFVIMDQHGNTIEGDLSKIIPKELKRETTIERDISPPLSKKSNLFGAPLNKKNDKERYIDSLKERTGMTEKEYDLVRKNYTQRSMIGVGSAFAANAGCRTPNQTQRQNIIHVHVDDNGNRALKSIEYRERIIANKQGEDGMPELDDNDKPIQTPLFDISYKLSFNPEHPQRTVTIQELSPEGKLQLPPCLQSKTISNPKGYQKENTERIERGAIDEIMQQAIQENNIEVAKSLIEEHPKLEMKLERGTLVALCQGALALDGEYKDRLIEGFIRGEIKQIKDKNPKFPSKEIADQAQEGIATLIGPQGINPDSTEKFNKALVSYIETESPKKLFPIVNFIKKCLGEPPEQKQKKLISKMRSQLQKENLPPTKNVARSANAQQKSSLVRQ